MEAGVEQSRDLCSETSVATGNYGNRRATGQTDPNVSARRSGFSSDSVLINLIKLSENPSDLLLEERAGVSIAEASLKMLGNVDYWRKLIATNQSK